MGFNPTPYNLLQALGYWMLVFGSFAALALVVSLLFSFVLHGVAGPMALVKRLRAGFADLTGMSWRRIEAITTLTFKEALRRKALMVFVVFAALFMFAGWFLADTNARADLQVKVYVSFVLTAIAWLVLPVALLLACWGIPEDIRIRSLHTVVTKPVRRSEVVVGRMLGFTAISTLVLLIMGVVGYVWIRRHVPSEALICRVPVYGTLSFADRFGNTKDSAGHPVQGLNVGDIWEFRHYIEGATKACATWEFDVGTPRDELNVESRFEAFRTHKGDIGKRVLCRMLIQKDELRVPIKTFQVAEFTQNVTSIPRKLAHEGKTYDVFDDLTKDGKVRIVVQCLDAGQYMGMAQSDLFLRLPDRSFASGFFKAMVGVWLMVVLVVMLGVTASCFVKGPVATLLTFSLLVVGQGFREFMGRLLTGQELGGGPVEAWYRIVTHMNVVTDLPEGALSNVIKTVDSGIIGALQVVQNVVPNFGHFRLAPYVANGFDVPWTAALLPCIAVTCAYVLPCVLIGYYSLTLRELEAK